VLAWRHPPNMRGVSQIDTQGPNSDLGLFIALIACVIAAFVTGLLFAVLRGKRATT